MSFMFLHILDYARINYNSLSIPNFGFIAIAFFVL